jgi:plasmid stability protein
MAQLTIRLDEDLARDVKAQAASSGRTLNGWVVAVLEAAVDPDLSGSEAERTRARLARAGLLASPARPPGLSAPVGKRVEAARRAAGAGTPLSDLVSEGRG